jgi:hypothetical protein
MVSPKVCKSAALLCARGSSPSDLDLVVIASPTVEVTLLTASHANVSDCIKPGKSIIEVAEELADGMSCELIVRPTAFIMMVY